MTEAANLARRPGPRISFVSLGCLKTLVDCERILAQLGAEGCELSRTRAGADAVIVTG
jgi:ribosomal protein S12 methylthiotransferase